MNNRDRWRFLKALIASAVTGVAEIGVLRYVLLPRIERALAANQIHWLRVAFVTHTAWFLLATLALAAAMGLPVLIVAMRTAHLGPWRDSSAADRPA